MVANWDFAIENAREFEAALDRLAEVSDDFRVPFGEIARDFYQSEKVIFSLKSAGKYDDFKNEESRQAKERLVGFEYPLLLRYGDLARSLLNKKDKNAIYSLTKKELEMGTKVEYAVHHQYGTKHMAERKVVFIDGGQNDGGKKGRRDRWLDIIKDYFYQELTGSVI